MSEGKKYLIRTDIGLVLEVELGLLEILRPQLDRVRVPYEVRDNPPVAGDNPPEETGETPKRRRSS